MFYTDDRVTLTVRVWFFFIYILVLLKNNAGLTIKPN